MSSEPPSSTAEAAKTKVKKSSKRYKAINSTFPTEVPELYNEVVATEDPYSAEVISQFGKPQPYFARPGFAPPRAYQFRGEFKDAQGRSYISFPDQPEWLGIRIPNRKRSGSEPLGYPEPYEIIDTPQGQFRILDLVLEKTRKTTAMVQVERV